MNGDKPKNLNEYKQWLKKSRGIEILDRDRVYYESVTTKIKSDFESSKVWVELIGNLKEFDSEYYLDRQYPLFVSDLKPEIYVKPFNSFIQKTFRKNVLENEHWPNPPNGDWILPDNWYSAINDIIRTLLVVKYLDGVEFAIDKIRTLCNQHSVPCKPFLEAREEGYYAAHLYTKQRFEIPRPNWDTIGVEVSIEIQITTQLQEVIRRLLHKYYEKRRENPSEDVKWQWNYKGDEFVANYLGHILHYVEGMIMEIRDRQREKTL